MKTTKQLRNLFFNTLKVAFNKVVPFITKLILSLSQNVPFLQLKHKNVKLSSVRVLQYQFL